MPAHTHPRSSAHVPGAGGVRLPWWALALPVIAFCVLLMLIAGPDEAHAAAGDDPGVSEFLRLVHRALAR
ncbi:hypothetical protein ACWGJT_26710 [Streptomyces xantholiticus]|uniref:Secreted protein n=1 Tax=Streptomyces xantholiticus TaxID=68285 RepID=A0ABV1V5Y2_9ACTN|nr:hypothetical protein CGZ69_07735 [Streptomyces peucetius subsp. caesius ATCC 27952]